MPPFSKAFSSSPPDRSSSTDASGVRVITMKELIETELPERAHLVSPWLRDAESALIYAPTGVGKSMFALSLALAMAGGGEYLGWECPEPRKVLYVDGEMHISDIQSRVLKLLNQVDIIDREQAVSNLSILPRHYQDPDIIFPSIAEEAGKQMILEKATGFDCDLVILDNLSTLACLRDENKSSEFLPVMSLLMTLKQHNKACILVHHSGKKGNNYRGSSMMGTTFEVIIGLKPRDDAKARTGASFTIEWDKYRGEPDSRCAPMDVWLDQDGWHYESSVEDDLSLMLAELRKGDYATQSELATALHWSNAKLSRCKAKAIKADMIDEGGWKRAFQSIDKGEAQTSTPDDDHPTLAGQENHHPLATEPQMVSLKDEGGSTTAQAA